MTTMVDANDDAFRLTLPLIDQPADVPLAVVGRQWCFSHPVTLHASGHQMLRSLTIKNETTHAPFAHIKHTESAIAEINTQYQPFAIFHVTDAQTKNQVLTVQREARTSTYNVHNGVLHYDEETQPCLFAATIHSPNQAAMDNNAEVDGANEWIVFRDATSGEPCRLEVDGDSYTDRVGLVRVRRGDKGFWEPVARISRPKRNVLLQARYWTIEVAAGVDAMFIAMLWLARWGEYMRQKPVPKSYTIHNGIAKWPVD